MSFMYYKPSDSKKHNKIKIIIKDMIHFVKLILILLILIAWNVKKICIYFYDGRKSHELINLCEINYTKESKEKLEKQIKNIEKKISDLDIIKEEIILEIDKLKNQMN